MADVQNLPDTKRQLSLAAALPAIAMVAAALLGLALLSQTNYLLFHGLVEGFSCVISCGVFMIAWNSRRFQEHDFFLCIGIVFLFVAGIDFLHTLAYQGMGVFPGYGPNLPTQLWVIGRFLAATGFLLAPLYLGRRLRPARFFILFLLLTGLLLAAAFSGTFPECFQPGSGLTTFKIGSEDLVCLLFAAALVLLYQQRGRFAPHVMQLLGTALVTFILADLVLTYYRDVYGLTNMTGHLLKVAGCYCLYRAVIVTGLSRPFDLLFRDLKAQEQAFRTLYQKTPVMLCTLDRQGNLARVSDYWLEHLGYAHQEVAGASFTRILDASSGPVFRTEILPALQESGGCRDIPCRVHRQDGTPLDVLFSAVTKPGLHGGEDRFLVVMTDVTELYRDQQQIEFLNAELQDRATELESSNRELEAFNYSVSHDLRGPLTAISSQCQILLEAFADRVDPEAREFIRRIYGQTLQMGELINTLLDFAKLGRIELQRQPVDLSDTARLLAAELTLRAPQRQVRCAIAEGLITDADPALLRILLENLLSNAWKYTANRDEARIEVGCLEHNRQTFFVRDNGRGFDPQLAAGMFSAFTRLHDTEDAEGFGIGLATVQRIVERHGGTIWAEGEAGRGATFFFRLAPEPPAAVPEAPVTGRQDFASADFPSAPNDLP